MKKLNKTVLSMIFIMSLNLGFGQVQLPTYLDTIAVIVYHDNVETEILRTNWGARFANQNNDYNGNLYPWFDVLIGDANDEVDVLNLADYGISDVDSIKITIPNVPEVPSNASFVCVVQLTEWPINNVTNVEYIGISDYNYTNDTIIADTGTITTDPLTTTVTTIDTILGVITETITDTTITTKVTTSKNRLVWVDGTTNWGTQINIINTVIDTVVSTTVNIEHLGLNETTKTPNFSIYPNPATHTITLNTTAPIKVYNLIGEVVATKQSSANGVVTLSVAHLPNGVYIASNGESFQKFIKE